MGLYIVSNICSKIFLLQNTKIFPFKLPSSHKRLWPLFGETILKFSTVFNLLLATTWGKVQSVCNDVLFTTLYEELLVIACS